MKNVMVVIFWGSGFVMTLSNRNQNETADTVQNKM